MNFYTDLQKYSVYNNTAVSKVYEDTDIKKKLNKPGKLAEQVYTPPQQTEGVSYYIYGINNISLNSDLYHIWRKSVAQSDSAQTVSFSITTNKKLAEYSEFYYNANIALLTLYSKRIEVRKQNGTLYAWNDDKKICTITHDLNGYIDFIVRKNGLQEIKVKNTVYDNNTLQLDFQNQFIDDEKILLKAFSVTSDKNLSLNTLIDFDKYKFSQYAKLNIYKEVSDQQTVLIFSNNYNDAKSMEFNFSKDTNYYIYGEDTAENSVQFYEVIIWKISQAENPKYQNVFSYQRLRLAECQWATYDNDQEFDLHIPYRFSFLGYVCTHNLDLLATDKTGQNISATKQAWPDIKTLTKDSSITDKFLYTLQNNQLKVITPDLTSQEQCQMILAYSSYWSESYYCDFEDQQHTAGSWSTINNIYNKEIKVLTLTHNLNGIVKIHLRNIREDLYDTYVLNNNTIQIVFPYHYKVMKPAFWVDLYTIWKQDN